MHLALAALFDVFESLPRCGPGLADQTLRALAACTGRPAAPRVVDLGCGPGPSALALAGAGCEVIAVDQHAPFIDTLQRRAAAAGLRVDARLGDMRAPGLPAGSVDVVWAEGSAYSVGLAEAFAAWRPLVGPGGWLACTELCWRGPDRPAAAQAFFEIEYPAMGEPAQVEALLAAHGWAPRARFWLPDEAWAAYYGPLRAALPGARARHPSPEAQAALDALAAEAALYDAHGSAYGYAFFIAEAVT